MSQCTDADAEALQSKPTDHRNDEHDTDVAPAGQCDGGIADHPDQSETPPGRRDIASNERLDFDPPARDAAASDLEAKPATGPMFNGSPDEKPLSNAVPSAECEAAPTIVHPEPQITPQFVGEAESSASAVVPGSDRQGRSSNVGCLKALFEVKSSSSTSPAQVQEPVERPARGRRRARPENADDGELGLSDESNSPSSASRQAANTSQSTPMAQLDASDIMNKSGTPQGKSPSGSSPSGKSPSGKSPSGKSVGDEATTHGKNFSPGNEHGQPDSAETEEVLDNGQETPEGHHQTALMVDAESKLAGTPNTHAAGHSEQPSSGPACETAIEDTELLPGDARLASPAKHESIDETFSMASVSPIKEVPECDQQKASAPEEHAQAHKTELLHADGISPALVSSTPDRQVALDETTQSHHHFGSPSVEDTGGSPAKEPTTEDLGNLLEEYSGESSPIPDATYTNEKKPTGDLIDSRPMDLPPEHYHEIVSASGHVLPFSDKVEKALPEQTTASANAAVDTVCDADSEPRGERAAGSAEETPFESAEETPLEVFKMDDDTDSGHDEAEADAPEKTGQSATCDTHDETSAQVRGNATCLPSPPPCTEVEAPVDENPPAHHLGASGAHVETAVDEKPPTQPLGAQSPDEEDASTNLRSHARAQLATPNFGEQHPASMLEACAHASEWSSSLHDPPEGETAEPAGTQEIHPQSGAHSDKEPSSLREPLKGADPKQEFIDHNASLASDDADKKPTEDHVRAVTTNFGSSDAGSSQNDESDSQPSDENGAESEEGGEESESDEESESGEEGESSDQDSKETAGDGMHPEHSEDAQDKHSTISPASPFTLAPGMAGARNFHQDGQYTMSMVMANTGSQPTPSETSTRRNTAEFGSCDISDIKALAVAANGAMDSPESPSCVRQPKSPSCVRQPTFLSDDSRDKDWDAPDMSDISPPPPKRKSPCNQTSSTEASQDCGSPEARGGGTRSACPAEDGNEVDVNELGGAWATPSSDHIAPPSKASSDAKSQGPDVAANNAAQLTSPSHHSQASASQQEAAARQRPNPIDTNDKTSPRAPQPLLLTDKDDSLTEQPTDRRSPGSGKRSNPLSCFFCFRQSRKQEKDAIELQLKAAIEGDDVEDLERAIAKGIEAGLRDDPLVVRARDRLNEVQKGLHQAAREQLSKAAKSGDRQELQRAKEEAEKAHLPLEEIKSICNTFQAAQCEASRRQLLGKGQGSPTQNGAASQHTDLV